MGRDVGTLEQGEMSRKRERISQRVEKQAEGKLQVKERILSIDFSLEGSRVPGPAGQIWRPRGEFCPVWWGRMAQTLGLK